ncbi:MAG: hypothetical protein IJV50_10910 [Lachnospiraceae bacterium]|nr:hypothetical protein [Lachnospiraceae bacterium]
MNIQSQLLMNMTQGMFHLYLLYATQNAGIYNTLQQGPKTIEQLSQACHIEKNLLKRLVRPVMAIGCMEERDGKLALTEMGEVLCDNTKDSLAGFLRFNVKIATAYWSKMDAALAHGAMPFEELEKQGFFDAQMEEHAKFDDFNEMMRDSSKNIDLTDYLQSRTKVPDTICDIGGGAGDIISKFLEFYPEAKGIVRDLSVAEEACKENLASRGITKDRFQFQVADFFREVPPEAELYILSRILHDWDDEKCQIILDHIGQAMGEQSQLLVIEKMIPKEMDARHMHMYMNDLYMWAVCGGKERTEEEFDGLFAKAGLKIKDIYPVTDEEYVIEIEKDNLEYGEL